MLYEFIKEYSCFIWTLGLIVHSIMKVFFIHDDLNEILLNVIMVI